MKLKYVVYDNSYVVVFGEYAQHKDVGIKYHTATSAGFFTMQEIDTPPNSKFCCSRMIEVNCYGESISLGLKSKPDDKFLLEKLFNS